MWSRNINVFAQLEGNISPSPMVEFDARLDKSYRQPRLPHSNTKHAKQPQPHWERGAWCNAAQLLLAAQHDQNLWTETPPTATSCHPFPQCISGQPLCNKQLATPHTQSKNEAKELCRQLAGHGSISRSFAQSLRPSTTAWQQQDPQEAAPCLFHCGQKTFHCYIWGISTLPCNTLIEFLPFDSKNAEFQPWMSSLYLSLQPQN